MASTDRIVKNSQRSITWTKLPVINRVQNKRNSVDGQKWGFISPEDKLDYSDSLRTKL